MQQEQLQALEFNLNDSNPNDFIIINSIERMHKLNTGEISFIQANDNYTTFHSIKKTKVTASKNLKFYEERLNENYFFRTHKSNMVNLSKVQSVDKKNNQVLMEDGTILPVASRRKKDFLIALEKLGKAF